jgi:hypothetical protein
MKLRRSTLVLSSIFFGRHWSTATMTLSLANSDHLSFELIACADLHVLAGFLSC